MLSAATQTDGETSSYIEALCFQTPIAIEFPSPGETPGNRDYTTRLAEKKVRAPREGKNPSDNSIKDFAALMSRKASLSGLNIFNYLIHRRRAAVGASRLSERAGFSLRARSRRSARRRSRTRASYNL